jgi:hypothetical protein
MCSVVSNTKLTRNKHIENMKKTILIQARQTLSFPGILRFHISKQSAHESGKVVSPKHRQELPQRKASLLISVKCLVDYNSILRHVGLLQ